MAKLHELLAVEGNLKGQAEKTRTDLGTTFEKKRHLFMEKRVTFQSNEEGKPAVTEEQSDLQTTVPKELAWIAGIWSSAINTSYAVAEANTIARADVVLEDGTVLLKNVPATALLELEKRTAELHELVSRVPTLDPAKGFSPDPDRGTGVYRAREDHRTRTQKTQKPIVLYEATKEHPAQVQLVSVDVAIGEIQTQEWSGLVTPAQKADMIERVEHLQRAVKKARSRANDTVITEDLLKQDVAKALFGYVFK